MTTLAEAGNIFKVLDDENKGYITVDKFIASFHNFYNNNDDEDKTIHENTLKSLITNMKPDIDGRITMDNFLSVFQQVQPEKNSNLKSRRYSQYSIKRFLSADNSEYPQMDELDNTNLNLNMLNNTDCIIETDFVEKDCSSDARSYISDNRLLLSNGYNNNRDSRIATSCRNLMENPLLLPTAAGRVRDLFSAGASPRGSDVHPAIITQEIGNNFDVLQMQMKRLEQKLINFHSDQDDLDRQQSRRMKEENKSLMQKINNMEDNLRELEESVEARLLQEKKEFKQSFGRTEDEKNRELLSIENRLSKLKEESADLSLEIRRYRDQSEMLRAEKHSVLEKLTESDIKLGTLQEEFDRVRYQCNSEVDNLKKEREKYERILSELNEKCERIQEEPEKRIQTMNKISQEYKELEDLVDKLREENKHLSDQILKSSNELLNKAAKEADDLLNSNKTLSKELSNCSKEELMDILARDKDSNFRLRDYIEKIIIKVMEKRPSLLEVGQTKK